MLLSSTDYAANANKYPLESLEGLVLSVEASGHTLEPREIHSQVISVYGEEVFYHQRSIPLPRGFFYKSDEGLRNLRASQRVHFSTTHFFLPKRVSHHNISRAGRHVDLKWYVIVPM